MRPPAPERLAAERALTIFPEGAGAGADIPWEGMEVSESTSDVGHLLEYLKRTRGFDFTGYKRGSLERRILRRLHVAGVTTFGDYVDYLEVHPEEFGILFNTVLINVTSFYRDPPAWEFMAQEVVPDLLARRQNGVPIRAWSAGCASGEEAYTLAMILAEAVGVDAFADEVKIYATDVDDDALAKARAAVYSEHEVAEVPAPLLAKYFDASDGRFTFRKDLRRQVIFGRHDLIQDAPISRVDILTCRNTLMYFNAETQARILARFQFSLNDLGILFLGRAETLMTHTNSFAPLDLKRRISRKLPTPTNGFRDRLAQIAQQHHAALDHDAQEKFAREARELRAAALESIPAAHLLVDADGTLILANERARVLFALSTADMGRPLRDLRVSYRPVELRSAIDQAYSDRQPTVLREVEWPSLAGDLRWFDVHVHPLLVGASGPLGASITFADVTAPKRLRAELALAHQALETAYEELQSTNEELETTNEELQSTVEELETTNEELQSTNEELETMNEELQSTNEELQTMNDELRQRSDELNQVNSFLESILTSMRGAVVVVDAELKILIWNDAAEEMWGLREAEVRGKHLLGLDIGLPTEQLKQPIRACLLGEKELATISLDAVNRRGRSIVCEVVAVPLVSRGRSVHGVILSIADAATVGTGIVLMHRADGNGATAGER